MKVAYGSDFHFERYNFEVSLSIIDQWKFEPYTELIIMAGDVASGGVKSVIPFLEHTYQTHKIPILYVLGNHEYYYTSFSKQQPIINMVRHGEGYEILNGHSVTIKGVTFIGASGTIDGSAFPITFGIYNKCADTKYIHDFDDYAHYGHRDAKRLKHLMRNSNHPMVIITHTIPMPRLIDDQYKGDPLNAFFVVDRSELIITYEPDVWVYGHTHIIKEQEEFETKFLVNAHGYEFEPTSFDWTWKYFTIGEDIV